MPQLEHPQPDPAPQSTRELRTARVWLLCALVILLEGFDLQAAGVSAPRLAPAFHLTPVQIGWFLGASSVGIFLSSALGGMFADRFGRRPVVAGGVGATATCGQATIFALAPLCYSSEARTTGVGATVSAGRFGTIAGPLMAGSLLGVGRSAAEVLIVLIPITLVSGLFVVGVARILGRKETEAGRIGQVIPVA
jgi:MFS family permease